MRTARVMRPVARLLAVAWLFAAVGADAAESPAPEDVAGEPRLRVELAPGPHTVGDRIPVTLEIVGPARRLAGEPVFPAWEATWGEAEVLSTEPPAPAPPGTDGEGGEEPAAAGGVRRWRQSLVLTAFRTGEVRLPPVTVRVPGPDGESELTTAPDLALDVESVLPAEAGEEAELEPPAPPQPLPWGRRFWITATLLALACAAAIAWAVRRRAGGLGSATAPALPPLDELRRALSAARGESAPRAGCTVVSLALRRYLGRALSFPAAESSTSEIRRRLAVRSLPPAATRRALAILAECDLVKFARRPLGGDEMAALADAALAAGVEIDGHLAALAAAASDEGEGGAPHRAAPHRGREAA